MSMPTSHIVSQFSAPTGSSCRVVVGSAAAAAVLYARTLPDEGLDLFYSTAVKSMSVGWKAFFYGAFDPAASITIDKLAGAFLPQALSARVFGFHPWSLALP